MRLPLPRGVPSVGWASQAIQRRLPELHGGHGGRRIELSRLFEASDSRARDSAWADFVAEHSRLLLHVARSLTADRDAAMDAYTYMLERLREDGYRRLRGYAPDGRSKFTTWLVVVVRRLGLDFQRHRYGRADDPDADASEVRAVRRRLVNLVAGAIDPEQLASPTTDPGAALQAHELQRALDAATARLPSADRLLLKLRFEDDLSAREIAGLLGLPTPFHVYRRLNAVLADLRRVLQQRGIEEAEP